MSISNSDKNPEGEVNVVSQSGPIRIELFDHQFKRHAIGFGQLHEHVPPGLYLLRSTAGEAQREQYLRVDAGNTLPIVSIDLPFASAAPIPGGSTSHEYHRYPAETLSRQPTKTLGSGGRLMVFARTVDGDGRSPASLVGLSLLDAGMHDILNLADQPAENQKEGWVGQCIGLNPGGYALRWQLPEAESKTGGSGQAQLINQSLFVAQGWITIVFLAYNSEDHRLERQSASIHMARNSMGFDANNVESNQAMELVLSGLRTGNLVVPDDLANQLLGKFQNPMLGIVGAHALLQRSQKNWATFDQVLGNLEQLIPGHPDVIGLRLMEKLANPDARQMRIAPLAWPPMLYTGYRALIASDWTPDWLNEDLIENGSVAEQAAASILPESPWTCWLAEKTSTSFLSLSDPVVRHVSQYQYIADHLQQMSDLKELSLDDFRQLGLPVATIKKALSDPVVRRVRRYIADLQQMSDLKELSLDDFRQLGLPVATIKKALQELHVVAEFSTKTVAQNVIKTAENSASASQSAERPRPAVYSRDEAIRVSRTFDWLICFTLFFVILGGYHVHFMLTGGDWDFWTDWKDRRLWVTVLPIVGITFPAAVQSVLWWRYRLPFGAVISVLGLLFGEWVNRYFNFWGWTYFPVNFVFPSNFMPGAIVLDVILMLSNSMQLTAVIGGLGYGLLFYPGNWPVIAPLHVPVEYNGMVMTLADLQGYHYVRTGTPEYIRMVEKGTLRTFGKDVAPASAFFSGFVCIIIYFLWHFFGRWFGQQTFTSQT